MADWRVKIWEVGHEDHPIESEHHGAFDSEEQVIDFYGLKNPDVSKYEIEQIG